MGTSTTFGNEFFGIMNFSIECTDGLDIPEDLKVKAEKRLDNATKKVDTVIEGIGKEGIEGIAKDAEGQCPKSKDAAKQIIARVEERRGKLKELLIRVKDALINWILASFRTAANVMSMIADRVSQISTKLMNFVSRHVLGMSKAAIKYE